MQSVISLPSPPRRRRRARRMLLSLLTVLVSYVVLAYILLPFMWRHYEHHPALEAAPKTTVTADGIPGDPLNIGLVGSQAEVIRALAAAGWAPADPVTFRTSIGIAASVVFREPDPDAPVSPLYVWGRKQDLAFEQPVGDDARQRHHVRLWRSDELGRDGRPFWIGAVTFDTSVGISHLTGQITHHIASDVDAERDRLIGQLEAKGQLVQEYQVSGVGATLNGRNGGGDRYVTDGELTVGVLAVENVVQAQPPEQLPNPAAVSIKNRVWQWLRIWLT